MRFAIAELRGSGLGCGSALRGGSEAAVAGECREDVVVVGGGGGEALALGIVSSRDI